MDTGWRDGFLFLGNQLSLDFLNTRPVLDGEPVELLADCKSLARWLLAAGIATKIGADWEGNSKAEAGRKRLLTFRESLRETVLRIEAGKPVPPRFLSYLNELLAQHPFVEQIHGAGGDLLRSRVLDLQMPEDVFAPLLDHTLALLTATDYTRIRKCAACVLHFYDTSKKGTRRWCSMELCGNRHKVAAYARRLRTDSSA